jgi:hypothetical protein
MLPGAPAGIRCSATASRVNLIEVKAVFSVTQQVERQRRERARGYDEQVMLVLDRRVEVEKPVTTVDATDAAAVGASLGALGRGVGLTIRMSSALDSRHEPATKNQRMAFCRMLPIC